ncbi:(2Fe-2S)-binding protein [Thermotoga sp. Ku-13t]|uniref:(2Fe-2S)-binding protein n=1 Tax=Thermotoga sp. Ku-13t TaxID=1755813 RepID=UPI0013E9B3E8|nr:(2Fe-2S)-binding protein [Thermotoga sp. Ku-13t]
MDEKIFVCRCEEVTLEEVRKYIQMGFTSFNELKRLLRVGMGPCQGRGCREIVLREISKATKIPISQLNPGTFRPPSKPLRLGLIGPDRQEPQLQTGMTSDPQTRSG